MFGEMNFDPFVVSSHFIIKCKEKGEWYFLSKSQSTTLITSTSRSGPSFDHNKKRVLACSDKYVQNVLIRLANRCLRSRLGYVFSTDTNRRRFCDGVTSSSIVYKCTRYVRRSSGVFYGTLSHVTSCKRTRCECRATRYYDNTLNRLAGLVAQTLRARRQHVLAL